MECQSFRSESAVPLVADASVAINLNATRCPEIILRALPNQLTVVEQVAFELEAGRLNGRNDAAGLDALVSRGEVEIVRLGEFGMERFAQLVSGPSAQSLDDGEAATIACALERQATAVIDERKATKLCSKLFPELSVASTCHLLAHLAIEEALGRGKLAEAVFNALFFGRMRVPSDHVDWVISLIGPVRAKQCLSLPRSARAG